VLSARDNKERVTFIAAADQDAFRSKVGPAFEVQVGLHELLGHGSGKTFTEGADGGLNFDPAAVVHPYAPSGKVTSWYKRGETWDSVFGAVASTMEECRAEAVGLVLCTQPRVLDIFGHGAAGAGDGADITYVNWLNMARAGLLALQYYNPSSRSWGQAHMQARHALLRVMLEAGLVTLPGAEGVLAGAALAASSLTEGDTGVHVRLARADIERVGLPAVAAFLAKLQVYKATADIAAGTALYARYTDVPDAWLPLRDLVLACRKPRQMLVQPVLEPVLLGDKAAAAPEAGRGTVVRSPVQSSVQMRVFPASVDGLLEAFVARFDAEDGELLDLWREEAVAHSTA
jgi:dipeptidyl-peptidase-3